MNVASSPGIFARFCVERGFFLLDVELEAPAWGVTAIFGPSGAGKTSILRAIAGLDHIPGGFLQVQDEVWQDDEKKIFRAPHRRATGCVFQDTNLFPHLSVRGNLDYAEQRRRSRVAAVPRAETVDMLDLGHLLDRMPGKLSGGEQQRVAIARALLTSPKLLLLDEPLASLDAGRKHEILPYLQRLHGGLNIPIIFVSHALDEVAQLADHLVLLDAGQVVGSGPLTEMLARIDLPGVVPQDTGVVVEGIAGAFDKAHQMVRLDLPRGSLRISHESVPLGEPMRARILSRDVSLSLEQPAATTIVNIFPAQIVSINEEDDAGPGQVLVLLDADGTPLIARITRYSAERLKLARGVKVWAQIKAVAVLA